MNIGVFGGSFNPVHNGHLLLAQNILKAGAVDELWFVVSPQNPLKDKALLLNDEERLDCVRKATQHIKGVYVSDIEFHLPKPSFMFQTLRSIQSAHKDDYLFLIIGADNWHCFNKWKNFDEILKKYNLLIYPRSGYPIDISSLPKNVCYLDLPTYDISSTQVRQMLSEGKDISNLVP